jgi:transcriptional regulator with XRE-family HTH domain
VYESADLGRAVGEVRRARGLTQEQLAAESGLTRVWLAKLEAGRATPVLDHLMRLLRLLGATVTVTFDTGGPDDPA